MSLSDLKPFSRNARQIDDPAYSGLTRSIARFGYVEPIVWNERSGRIVGGHQRFKILMSKGIEEATIVVVDFSEEEEIAANITLNNPEIEGDFDDPAEDLLNQIEESSGDAFSSLRLDKLRNALETNTTDTSSMEDAKPDTVCPCCNHEWLLSDDDIEVEVLK